MNYNEIIIQKQNIMAKFNEHNVDVIEVLRFIDNAKKAECFAIAEEMWRRLEDHMDKKEAGMKSWEKGE